MGHLIHMTIYEAQVDRKLTGNGPEEDRKWYVMDLQAQALVNFWSEISVMQNLLITAQFHKEVYKAHSELWKYLINYLVIKHAPVHYQNLLNLANFTTQFTSLINQADDRTHCDFRQDLWFPLTFFATLV